ncbi:transcriptional repressor TCF25-domain-containing protein [Stachybotrys elegans]|uniref:Transcriptional repressor TCF25-domain-containing protein n=1 Tax=Stachybotrys elegans TaxID=80388 RepID=A0A8K0WRR1_9HYPO|nr:transcriptional repressor TCF25-domain-containing protein [Stachybotrys elegans]
MSTRQLRKLERQRELEKATQATREEPKDSDEEDELIQPAAKPRASLFAALGGDDEEDQDDEDEEDQVPQEPKQASPATEAPLSSKKSKKKKKKKGKKQASSTTDATGIPPEKAGTDEDEIDKAIKELQLDTNAARGSGGHEINTRRRINELLKINTYHLKAVNEMRNLFGREAMEAADAEEGQEQNRRRRGPVQQQVDLETFLRGTPGAKRLPEITLRRNLFIQGRDHWPRQSAGGLTMKEVQKVADGSWTEYTFCHDREYDTIQTTFFALVQMGDPMRLVYLLKECPYHISTLLQVSNVAKQDQNMALASELCERALFTFGRLATSSFRQNIEQGTARLDFRRPENREFWLAGYHYIRSLVRKGTYRTALEWAKLIYTLDPKDPYAMRHLIHFLAVRAHESKWFIDFMKELEQTSVDRDLAYIRQTLVLAKLQIGETEEAGKELARGMQEVPWLYCALFQELNLDAPPSIWGISSDSDSRSFWVKLYISKTKDLWNNTQAMGLLKTVAKSLERVDATGLPSDDAPADQGATRLAYLDGDTSLLAVAPRELLEAQPNYEFDPLPPAEEDNIFSTESMRLPWQQQDARQRGPTQEMLHQMEQLLGRRLAAAGAAAGADAGADSEDEEMRRVELEDDEELRRDLEAHAARANEPGLIGTLLQMLGVARNGQAGERAGESDGLLDNAGTGDEVPGSWPDDDDDGDRNR